MSVDINYIKTIYPELYDSAKIFIKAKKKIDKYINDKYGKDTLLSIIKQNEYNKEIDNVQKNIKTNDESNKLAQTYVKYFNIYTKHAYNFVKRHNQSNANEYLKLLENYEFN